MKRTLRAIALSLALVLILPLALFTASAEPNAPTVLWAGDDFEGTDFKAKLSTFPSTLSAVKEADGNTAVRFEAVGKSHPTRAEAYYAVSFGANAGAAKYYPLTDTTVNPDGTVNGTVEISGTSYTVKNAVPDQNAEMSDCKGYALYTGDQLDAFIGGGNVAVPMRMRNPEISAGTADKIAFEASYYFGNGTYGTFASRARSADNGYIELFGVRASGSTVTVQAHENSSITSGAALTVSTEKWIKITAILDTTTGYISVFVNGEIAFIALNASKFELSTPVSIQGNTWNLLQLNRGSKTASSVGGYVMIDDASIYNGSNISTVIVPSFRDNFEKYAKGTQLTTAWGYNTNKPAEIAAYNKVLSEENGNQFVRFPVVYDGNQTISTAGYTNYDKTLMINQPGLSASDEFMVLAVSYRPHGNETTAAETIELQLRNFSFDMLAGTGAMLKPRDGVAAEVTTDIKSKAGHYLNLFSINIKSGALNFPGHGSVVTGAAGLVQDEWNDIRYVLNLKSPSALIYVNGELYATLKTMTLTGTDWSSCTGASNLTVPGGNVIIAKGNKVTNAFKTVQSADDSYSNVNYIDIDNVSVNVATGEELLGSFDPTAYTGIVSTDPTASVRHIAPGGLRFTSVIDTEKLDALHAMIGESLLSLEFGTLITLAENLENTDFTVEALKAAGKDYVTVTAEYGKYYSVGEDGTRFSGSVAHIKDTHLESDFAGIGYVKLNLVTGEEYFYYSETATQANVKATAQSILDTSNLSGYSASSKKTIEAFASGESLADIIARDMNGLNVLALGDSLFAGTDEGTPGCDRASQWVNLLGGQNGWSLTNLGIGGMTVSHTDANYDPAHGRKASMYDWLYNNVNNFYWGNPRRNDERLYYPGTSYGYNSYYQCGSFAGKTAEDVDLIILEGGCNDYGTAIAAPLGTLDSRDPATFLGAWNLVTEKLLEQYPNAKIVFLTTWYLSPQSRPDNLTSIEYSTSVNRLYEEVYADNDRIYLVDAGNPAVSGVDMKDTAWRNEYSNDSYHLKNNGMAIMAKNMLPYLWEIYINASEK